MISDAVLSALNYLVIVVPFVVVGIVLAELIIALEYVSKIAWITKPITRFGHLRKECGIAFLTAFASPAAANSMLMEFHTKKLIERNELIIASIVNSFPVIIMVYFRYILPALIPLLAVTGMIYFGVIMSIGFIQTFLVLTVGGIILPRKDDDGEIEKGKQPPLGEAFKASIKNSKKMIKRVLILFIPITLIIFILIDVGVFEVLADNLSGIASYFPVPVEGLPIIAIQFANEIAAYPVARDLLSQGVLTSRDVVLTLLIGDVLSSIVKLRFSIPYYLGIFGMKLGTQILAISTMLRITIMILMIATLVVLW